MKTNLKTRGDVRVTHEGGPGMAEAPIPALRRMLNAHMLYEGTFYVDGVEAAEGLARAVVRAVQADPAATREAIIAARVLHNIRHAPLLATAIYATGKYPETRALVAGVLRRADEPAELLAMLDAKAGMTHAVRKGIVDALATFDAYQAAKYKGEARGITLRDVVFLTHPDPEKIGWVQPLIDGTLPPAETWEVGLSAGRDKREVFEELLRENKLGAMALLRNLRGMSEAGVSRALIQGALERANWAKVLPFRFLSAAKHAPQFGRDLDTAFAKAVERSVYLPGKTAVLIDHSGSMNSPLSQKSEVKIVEAANALGAAINGDAVDHIVWASVAQRIGAWPGLVGALTMRADVGYATVLGPALEMAMERKPDRIIVLSDLQLAGITPALPKGVKGYTINMAPHSTPGLLRGSWTHLTGWSPQVLNWIAEEEADGVLG